MKIFLLINLIALFFFSTNLRSEEIQFENSEMKIIDTGNIILGYESKVSIPSKKIVIVSRKAEYNKKEKIITFYDDVVFEDKENNIIIKGDKLNYNENKDLIFSESDTKINLEKKYKIDSNNVYFNRALNKIFSKKETLIEDDKKNFYILKDSFNFDINDEIIKSKKSIILDNNFNKYIFEDLIIYLKNNEIVGKEIKVEFEDSYFGDFNNDPLLKGRGAYSNDKELKVYKAVFSTCSIEGKKCRGWELNTDEFNHNKKEKIFDVKIPG